MLNIYYENEDSSDDGVFMKLECKVNGYQRLCRVSQGDSIYIKDSIPVQIGDKYKDYNNTIVSRIDYMPKKWWQFWKPKKQIGYVVSFL